jgi:hypothetical protein
MVTLGAAFTKNKKTASQPLPTDVAGALRGYLASKPAGQPVWPGGWVDNAAEMLQCELEATDIPYVIDGPDGPLFADFHSLRHSFIALLDKCGATLKEAMQLARHSDPKLTMAVYGRAKLHDLAGAVSRLPMLLEAPEKEGGKPRATGTQSESAPAYTTLTQTSETNQENTIRTETMLAPATEEISRDKSLILQEDEAIREQLSTSEESSPSRTRTYNLPVNTSRSPRGVNQWVKRFRIPSGPRISTRKNVAL